MPDPLSEQTAAQLLSAVRALQDRVERTNPLRVHPDTCATCGEVLTLENISRRDPGHCTRCAIVQPEDPTPCAGPSKGCMHPGCGETPSHRRPGTWVDGNGTPMTGTYCTIHATQLERAGVRMIRGINPTPGLARTAWNRLDNGDDDL